MQTSCFSRITSVFTFDSSWASLQVQMCWLNWANMGRRCIIKANSVAVRMVLISSEALVVAFCVHFKMLVVRRDGSQMRHDLCLVKNAAVTYAFQGIWERGVWGKWFRVNQELFYERCWTAGLFIMNVRESLIWQEGSKDSGVRMLLLVTVMCVYIWNRRQK